MASSFSSALLRIERRLNGVAVLTFTVPKQLNAMSVALGKDFERAMTELSADDSLRALVLTGEGRAFSAGGDLEFLNERLVTPPSTNATAMRAFYRRFLRVREVPVPTIAAINGPAVGAGMALATACDIRLAAEGTRLGFNFTQIGIPPGMGSSYLLQRVTNPQVAARLLLTGELVTAEEAKEMGLVLSVHPADQVLPSALKIADTIASASPLAVRSTVKTLRMHVDTGLDAALQREADSQAIAYAHNDLRLGLESVKTKKAAVFPDVRTG